MNILVGCEFSGAVRDAFIVRGHDAVSCDLLPTEKPGPHIQRDILKQLHLGWDMGIFFPECTHHTVSGARWFTKAPKHPKPGVYYGEDRYRKREEDRAFVLKLWESDIPYIAIENPVGTLGDVLGPPTQIIQPYMFGHAATKATCLWLKNLPKLTPTNWVMPPWAEDIHQEPPGPERKKNRSRTFPGIADAMAEQWGTVTITPQNKD